MSRPSDLPEGGAPPGPPGTWGQPPAGASPRAPGGGSLPAEASPLRVPAVVAAGEGPGSRKVYGENKVYLALDGRALVAHVVATLQRVPEVSEVLVVGNAERLDRVLGDPAFRSELTKPLRIVPQFRNLYENCWEAYRRLLPGAPPEGRDPVTEEDRDLRVLYLSGDLPFATAQEISDFIRRAADTGADFVMGSVEREALEPFARGDGDRPAIRVAFFNLAEGRLRQNNLFLVRPGRLGNRQSIEEMYEHRYQKQLGNILALAWRLFWSRGGGPRVLFFYALMHLAGVADRHGWRRLSDWLRHFVPLVRVERAVGALLDTRFRVLVTSVGGCGIDIDREAEYDAARARYREWRRQQEERALELHGPLPLPARAGEPRASEEGV